MESVVQTLNQIVWETPAGFPWLVALLLGTGFFVTLSLGFLQLRKIRHALQIVSGKFDRPEHEGDVTHFQALSTALSATVGIGNIAGVATAIHYGGPGAIFWMWLCGFFGMALKYTECTLSMQHRAFDERGFAAGGPMYYIERGLGPKWKPLAIVFAFCCVISSFGGGNMNQANTVAVSLGTDFGLSPYVVGVVLAILVGAVILGGIKRIAKVSSLLAPAMAAIYVSTCIVILLMHLDGIPAAIASIFESAFNPKASLGGSVAGVFSVSLLWGVKRGLFSNEAGQGSAPIAHAAARTDEPVREGAVALLEPLIDTLLICTMTALVILVTGVWDQKSETELPIGHTRIVSAAALERPAETEAARIASALSAPPEAGTIQVEEGRQTALAFIGRESVAEAALLFRDGKPFTGQLTYDLGQQSVSPGGLTVRGRMLKNSSALTAEAFERGLSSLFGGGNYIVTLCVMLFALSTIISWSYYGDRCVTYLWGARWVLWYRVVYTAIVFVGAVTALEVVWAYGDLALGLMTVPNLIAVLILLPRVRAQTRDYFERMGS